MEELIKVLNRSDGIVTYVLPELNIRRVFNINETKELEMKELQALAQTDGGAELIKDYLIVDDMDFVRKVFDPPIEYNWGYEEIKKCILEDSIELFSETLDFAPRGVVELIKMLAWQIPLTDLNKIGVIKNKLGFDVLAAIQIMSKPDGSDTAAPKERQRLREEV